MSQSTDHTDQSVPASDPAVELGHDEFDPIGTVVLIAIYFLILVGMWIFTYFVEFLGNDPSVVGLLAPVIVG
ncbi:hypothetical protein [Halovivax limisalsi]|uniref:hypothetical protein n=1 Tax=Halovivax limisalsi TaxID=1453760 RepID=UPI001FFD8A7E|nr:hypothetical protein [Halovivax limisalsi]